MHAAEVLTVLAEISIALAGFAGIVVALRQRGLHEFEPHELVRFWFMLGVACELLFFALLPFLFHHAGQGIGRRLVAIATGRRRATNSRLCW